jgi:hypothetical protein
MLQLTIHPGQEFWQKMDIQQKETLDIQNVKEQLKQNKLLCT